MRAPAALLVSLLLVAGCGDDADPTVKASYVAKAEAICAQADAQQKKLAAPTGVTDFSPYVTKVVAIAASVLEDLTALDPPEADKAELQKKVFGPLKEQLTIAQAYAKQVETAARTKDQPALIRLAGSPPTETKADLRFMKRYGFTVCVKAADTSD